MEDASFHNIMYTSCSSPCPSSSSIRRSNDPPSIASHDFLRALLRVTARQHAGDGLPFLLHPLKLLPLLFSSHSLSAKHTTPLLRLCLALHLLRNLDVDLEELAHAAVQADRLALVQVGLAVLGRDALLGAGVDEPDGACVSCLSTLLPLNSMRAPSLACSHA